MSCCLKPRPTTTSNVFRSGFDASEKLSRSKATAYHCHQHSTNYGTHMLASVAYAGGAPMRVPPLSSSLYEKVNQLFFKLFYSTSHCIQ